MILFKGNILNYFQRILKNIKKCSIQIHIEWAHRINSWAHPFWNYGHNKSYFVNQMESIFSNKNVEYYFYNDCLLNESYIIYVCAYM